MSEKRVLAVVNGKEITEDTVLKFLNDLGPQMAMQFQSPEGIKRVVDELVNQELIYLNALENELDKEEGFTKELERLKEGLLKQYALNNILSEVTVTEGEILEFYNKNKENFKKPETVIASHILVDNEDKAKDIINEINNGLSFEEAAQSYSSCPSKERGGNLGEFTKGQMVPEFETAAFNMEVDTISEPVKTQFGYHIIKLLAKNKESLSTFDEIKKEITQQVLGMKQQQVYLDKTNQLKQKYEVVNNM
ncbi:peptidyl-prolyl cis-trans isomerase C [Tissierella praeacuta DSM 18095]|uniref:Peptidyl-prolyl cis-trans isomerase C n=1 Tax=Tissierella praeacuta DSM 18095 TaxID=1123404 RepID=A0A1M4S4K2_9FIRM|nr:peptidylprolyl isomerase [Tissierella praeacuta]SHE27128.1 peptidyl-prolyl cis-trans isomerase C [Tissierella praeacuta DSM 18095]SUP00808.1 Putative peptidyl-prolyl cis-trans isomerase Cbf2 precursor [Tissierella praeacuta]